MTSPKFFRRLTVLIAVAFALDFSARADVLELTNGDHYRGTVISLNETTLEFQSEIQGRVKLPRAKVAQITLNALTAKTPNKSLAPATTNAAIFNAPLILSGNRTPTPAATPNAPIASDAVIQQMRQQGIDPKIIAQVQQQVLSQSSPDATLKFNQTLAGLMSGSISVQDLRAQAQSSIKQIQDAKKELGGDAGDMLDGYLSILQNFVNEAATDNTITKPTDASASGK